MKKEPGRPRKVRTGNRGRPCKLYNMMPTGSNIEVEPGDEAAGLIKHLDPASTLTIIDPNADEWKDSNLGEYTVHILGQTWDIVDYLSSRNPN